MISGILQGSGEEGKRGRGEKLYLCRIYFMETGVRPFPAIFIKYIPAG